MSRRVIDLTSPGGYIKNSEIESFVNKTAKLDKSWEVLSNKTASTFLTERGWPFDQDLKPSFVFSSINSEQIDVSNYNTIELSKYGQCHVIDKLPELEKEGPGQGFKLILNIMHEAYPLNEFHLDEMVEGLTAGIRLFFDDSKSQYSPLWQSLQTSLYINVK